MDFRLSEEQEAFRKAVARFVDTEVAPVADRLDEAGEFPRELFRKLGQQGYLALRYPEAYGGAEADMTTYCLFAEEMARGSMSMNSSPTSTLNASVSVAQTTCPVAITVCEPMLNVTRSTSPWLISQPTASKRIPPEDRLRPTARRSGRSISANEMT